MKHKALNDEVIVWKMINCSIWIWCVLAEMAAWSTEIGDDTSQDMKELVPSLSELLKNSVAKSTAKKYNGSYDQWRRWAQEQGIGALPARPVHVALYLTKLTQEANSPAPVSAAVYAISWKHQVFGWADPCQEKIVTRTHEAARRILAQPKRRKQPATKPMIQKLFAELSDTGSLKDLMTVTLVVVAFAGMMRWDDLSHIYADEVEISSTHMSVFLEVRKNDQLRHGHRVIISRWPGEICPVALVEELLANGGYQGHSPLFGRIRKSRSGPRIAGRMSYSRARELVKEAFERIGVDSGDFGLHSFRSGGASLAAAMGVPERLIRRHGGWRSESGMRPYLEETLPALLSVSQNLAIS